MSRTNSKEPPRRKPAQARSQETVNAIVEASADVLQHRGYSGATTNRIAERAGVSIGTLYQYFNNKNEIFDELIHQEAGRYLHALEQCMPGAGQPLRAAIRTLLEAGYAHTDLVLGIRIVMRNLPSYSDRGRELRQELHKLVVQFLELHGPFPGVVDVDLAADVMIAQCEGLTFLGRIDRTEDELIEVLTDSLSRYLLGGEAG